MSRPRKEGKFVNAYIKKDLVDRMENYSESSFMPKTAIIELALQEYLDKVEQRPQKAV